MEYTIGQAAALVNLNISTLRYYDKEGLLPQLHRSPGGSRLFTEADMDYLRLLECLKRTGMSLKEIKQFIKWCKQGDKNLRERRQMFEERRAAVEQQMDELRETLQMIAYKCWYYDTALQAGTEQAVRSLPLQDVPREFRHFFTELEEPSKAPAVL